MAVNHELHTPFGATELKAGELQGALVQRVPYGVADAAEAAALDLTGLNTLALMLSTDIFAYDATDTVTVHDGVTCLVTSDGKRFKNDGTRAKGIVNWSVKAADLIAPPGSPAIGDAYLLPPAPTGAWAAYGKHIAVYTQRGWVFPAPRSGMLVYVEDEDAYRRYNGTVWVSGFGSAAISDGGLTPVKMQQAYGERAESETATPPGAIPAEGTLYIVGSSATGAWAGEDGNIARVASGAWVFDAAQEGMTVFNKALGYNVSFKSGVWQRDLSAGVILYRGNRVDLTGSAGLTTGATTTILNLGSRALINPTNRIVVRASVEEMISAAGNPEFDIGLFVDTETVARDSVTTQAGLSYLSSCNVEFEFDPGDTAARDYFIKAVNTSGINVTTDRASAVLMEVAG